MYITPLEYLISITATDECVLCKHEANMLCQNCCMQQYTELESRCYICNKLVSQNKVCSSCRSRSSIRRVWWLDKYDGSTKQLVAAIKLGRKRHYAREFGIILADVLPYLPKETLVIGVPTASKRRRMRGFDQAEFLAAAFSREREFSYCQPFLRMSQTDQIGKRRSERLNQVQNSLKVIKPDLIKNSSILLLDDVLTTGATLEAAAKLLRKNGAKHVDAAVIARHQIK